MAKGTKSQSESKVFFDEVTGTKIRQVTDHASIHHHPFYYLPCFDDAQQRMFFVSHRTGRPEIFAEIQDTGELVQFTEHEGLGEWSVHPSHDGRYVYFTSALGAWRVNTETLEEERLFNFEKIAIREKGMATANGWSISARHIRAIPSERNGLYMRHGGRAHVR